MKRTKQLEFEFVAEVPVDWAAEGFYELAQQVAPTISVEGHRLRGIEPYLIGIFHGRGAPVGEISLWGSKDLAELGKGPAHRCEVHAEWSDRTVNRGMAGAHERNSGLKAWTTLITGVEGFAAYEAYLHNLARAVKRAQPSAVVVVGRRARIRR